MEKLKKYGNSIWRVPLIAVIAGFLYAPIYTRIVLGFGIIQPGVIDKRVSLFAGAGITMAVFILGGMLLLRGLSKKERFISAFVLSAYGILLLLVQSLLGAVTGPGAIVFMYHLSPCIMIGSKKRSSDHYMMLRSMHMAKRHRHHFVNYLNRMF